MKKQLCDLCGKTNTFRGNQEIWGHLNFFARRFLIRVKEERTICLHCISKLEDVMDKIISDNKKNKQTGDKHAKPLRKNSHKR